MKRNLTTIILISTMLFSLICYSQSTLNYLIKIIGRPISEIKEILPDELTVPLCYAIMKNFNKNSEVYETNKNLLFNNR